MIPYLDLHKINEKYNEEFKNNFANFLDSGYYILGDSVSKFENEFASYCGTKYCIGVGNGLDALEIIFKSYIQLNKLKLGDKVLVPANTYIASILAIINSGLEPVFVDASLDNFNINLDLLEDLYCSEVKAILVVHLYGQLVEMKRVNEFAKSKNILVVEDAAQAHGARTKDNIKAGNLSSAAGFSFYPSKNLGALGDAGAITTNDKELFEISKVFRNYGSEIKYKNSILGVNSRLDEIQAKFLSIKLDFLDNDNKIRQNIADEYINRIKNSNVKLLPYVNDNSNVFHVFPILVNNREDFMKYMLAKGVSCYIHYPIAPHKQEALRKYKDLHLPNTIYIHSHEVSLPLNPIITSMQVEIIINAVNSYIEGEFY